MFLFLVSITVSRALVISLSPWSRMPSTLLSTSLTPTDTPPMATIICWLTSVKRLLKEPGPMTGFSGDSPSAFSCIVKGEKKNRNVAATFEAEYTSFTHAYSLVWQVMDFFPLVLAVYHFSSLPKLTLYILLYFTTKFCSFGDHWYKFQVWFVFSFAIKVIRVNSHWIKG